QWQQPPIPLRPVEGHGPRRGRERLRSFAPSPAAARPSPLRPIAFSRRYPDALPCLPPPRQTGKDEAMSRQRPLSLRIASLESRCCPSGSSLHDSLLGEDGPSHDGGQGGHDGTYTTATPDQSAAEDHGPDSGRGDGSDNSGPGPCGSTAGSTSQGG